MSYDVRNTKLLELDLVSVQISFHLGAHFALSFLILKKKDKEKLPIRPVILG